LEACIRLSKRDNKETYLDHRLIKQGYNGSSLFSQKAIDPLFRGSNGIPRLINMLAHEVLMVAFGKDDYALNDKCIELAVEDTETL
jgi:MSHA biogenesis protein MshM